MGTRHSIEVKIDDQIKVAQYGQWDGYPTGQGIGIAEFLHKDMDISRFKSALRNCRFMSDEEIEKFNLDHTDGSWGKTYPWFSRDTGSGILGLVQEHFGLVLIGNEDFKNDSLHYEFHYLINMDDLTVTMNGGSPIPFSEWTAEKMAEIEE
ncbi:MAG: hypothetical protein V3R41_03785 [Gammaproteobacteria bacterium]